jgi:hypothetical protein
MSPYNINNKILTMKQLSRNTIWLKVNTVFFYKIIFENVVGFRFDCYSEDMIL